MTDQEIKTLQGWGWMATSDCHGNYIVNSRGFCRHSHPDGKKLLVEFAGFWLCLDCKLPLGCEVCAAICNLEIDKLYRYHPGNYCFFHQQEIQKVFYLGKSERLQNFDDETNETILRLSNEWRKLLRQK